jgi:hypothetical protein
VAHPNSIEHRPPARPIPGVLADARQIPEGGLEPPSPFGQWILNPPRLPIPPLRHIHQPWIFGPKPPEVNPTAADTSTPTSHETQPGSPRRAPRWIDVGDQHKKPAEQRESVSRPDQPTRSGNTGNRACPQCHCRRSPRPDPRPPTCSGNTGSRACQRSRSRHSRPGSRSRTHTNT